MEKIPVYVFHVLVRKTVDIEKIKEDLRVVDPDIVAVEFHAGKLYDPNDR